MSDPSTDLAEKLAQLRCDFDQVFASPHQEKTESFEGLLAIRLKGDRYGLSIREIAGIEKAGPLVRLPSRSPGLLGITGRRGAVLPVYRLATLLGYEETRDPARWLALCGGRETLALGFEELEGYATVPETSFFVPDGGPRNYVHRFARIGETVRAIVSVPAILEAIQGGA